MKYKKGILLFLIIFWISIAFFNVFYNSVKSVSELLVWVPLSQDQKLQKIFGSSYEFSKFINANTPRGSDILFYSEEPLPYFYARYRLYPHHLYWYQNTDEYVKTKFPKNFEYVAVYNMSASLVGYEKVASFSAKNSNVFGSLYKKK